MVVPKRAYTEYNKDNILNMGHEGFQELLSQELYSLVLVYRLYELMDYFLLKEEYMFCHVIQCFFDENNIK